MALEENFAVLKGIKMIAAKIKKDHRRRGKVEKQEIGKKLSHRIVSDPNICGVNPAWPRQEYPCGLY